MLGEFLQRRVGRAWDTAGETLNWWTSPRLSRHIDEAICPGDPPGMIALVAEATGGRPLGLGVSVGSGEGNKEFALMRAGLVERFLLYDLSQACIDAARAAARAEGLEGRVEARVESPVDRPLPEPVDFVYWDHALHHMMDVEAALKWSVAALRPGGLLVVNDYIGPPRLVWRREEVREARRFLAEIAPLTGRPPEALRHKSVLSYWRTAWKDPSEARESHLIAAAFARQTGTALRPIGGAMIHLCAPFVVPHETRHPGLAERLIAFDLAALNDRGMSHFGVGVWHKPGGDAPNR